MNCDLLPGAPICDPGPGKQTTSSGRGESVSHQTCLCYGIMIFRVEILRYLLHTHFLIFHSNKYISYTAFFNVKTIMGTTNPSNMPEGFDFGPYDVVPNSGTHAWNPTTLPAPGEWEEPIWIMGTYDGGIASLCHSLGIRFHSWQYPFYDYKPHIFLTLCAHYCPLRYTSTVSCNNNSQSFYEPMIPLDFITGDTNVMYEEDLTYVGQTIDALPTSFSVIYNASTKKVVLVLTGKTSGCQPGQKKSKKKAKSKKTKKAKKPKKG